ncbi:alpha/beta-Hydrolase [Glarea lozoyensis ATCC 20868]|uniref:Alpha/beta-Hydrolase n=1 Tax=Glarea lozoyensis (strain ATCC 20868 / MF5171) TaxID=1116229 RepID=S3DQ31_GLAL2|nr:alpha/beta-Hydrolase [Glarea lozoyensis ATCC 20868]EPE34171.1 alpha/beta-Hydrolase [Glarea lozoyensis ATCC 20868]
MSGFQVQSKACCTRPPVTLSGGYDYTLQGKYVDINGLKTYVTGNPKATRGILLVYDVFGLYIQTLRGADILASGYDPVPDGVGDFQVFMPDFFGDNPQDMANFPPKTPKQYAAITKFMTGPANPPDSVKLIGPLMETICKDHPEIESWATLGMCWGGKVCTLVSGKGTIFKASGQFHPSLMALDDAIKVTIPHCVLPSMDEDVKFMDEWIEKLKVASPKSYAEYFDDQVHGWTSSRADFNNLHNFEEYLRAYRIVRSFFASHL